MENSIYLFTSFPHHDNIKESLEGNFEFQQDEENFHIPNLQVQISDGNEYFLNQKNGMINFYSSLMNPEHLNVHSKFLMHLASCVKGYKITFSSRDQLTPVVNQLIEDLHGLVFSPDMSFYTSDWKLLINSSGECNVDDYEVKMSSQTFDANVFSNDESEARKQRTIAMLQAMRIQIIQI